MTLLLTSTRFPYTTLFRSLYKKVPYHPIRDFAPITLAATAPLVLIVNNALPAQTLAEFVALAKREPGKLSYGTAGIGTAPRSEEHTSELQSLRQLVCRLLL